MSDLSFEYHLGWWLYYFPVQSVPGLGNPTGEQIFPNIQSKPTLEQLKVVFSHPIACYQGEEADTQDEATVRNWNTFLVLSASWKSRRMKCRESFTCWGDIHFVVLFAGGRQKDNTHTEQSNEGCTPQSCMSAASCFPAQGHTWGMGAQANMRFEVLQLGRGYETTGNGSALFHMTGELLDRWDICRLRKKKELY